MKCPLITDLPTPPLRKTGWPWTNSSAEIGAPSAEVQASPSPNNQYPITNNSEFPRISIVMPCFNAVAYVEEALRSVLLQGYPDLELIVMDGGSTDGTVDVIMRYESWLTYWISEKDRGQSHAINKGLERATGELFNWFNADDVMCPGTLFVLAVAFESNPGAVGAIGSILSFDEQGGRTVWKPVLGNKEEIGNWAAPTFLPQPSALFDCQLCKQIGGVNEKLHYVMDIELMMRLADHGVFVTVDQVTSHFRAHAGSKTFQGDIPGLVELVAAEFNLGMVDVARRMLKRRMDGYAGLKVDRLTDAEVGKIVDKWRYSTLAHYVAKRLQKNFQHLFVRKT